MIISASRRTDIPALYSDWFMSRVRAGWCAVPQPMNMKRVSRVSLEPRDVDAIVFWSKNPAPLLPHLDELDSRGFRYYFLLTLNDYPRQLEPGLPDLDARVEAFRALSRRTGPARVVWRYDPIIISNVTSFDYHKERFARLAGELRQATERVIVSFVDYYRKTERRLGELQREGFVFDRKAAASDSAASLLGEASAIARRAGMEMFTCAEDRDCTRYGLQHGRCIDDRLLRSLWPLSIQYRKDPSQRDRCLCTVSRDIGVSDTCVQGCPYCYSTISDGVARKRYLEHDADSPALWGHSVPPDQAASAGSAHMRLLS